MLMIMMVNYVDYLGDDDCWWWGLHSWGWHYLIIMLMMLMIFIMTIVLVLMMLISYTDILKRAMQSLQLSTQIYTSSLAGENCALLITHEDYQQSFNLLAPKLPHMPGTEHNPQKFCHMCQSVASHATCWGAAEPLRRLVSCKKLGACIQDTLSNRKARSSFRC